MALARRESQTDAASVSSPRLSREEDEACLAGYSAELNYLVRTLERMGVDFVDVEDLAQEVFVILRRNWTKFDQSRDLRPFIFGITFRVVSSYRRRRWREPPCEISEMPDQALSPEGVYESKQERALILSGLQMVPLCRRAVLVMYDLDQVPVKEIAKALSIPVFTVYSRLRKARKELMLAIQRARSASSPTERPATKVYGLPA